MDEPGNIDLIVLNAVHRSLAPKEIIEAEIKLTAKQWEEYFIKPIAEKLKAKDNQE